MIQDSAKTILCYGDSNTWGNVPRSDSRYPRSVRWPGALQQLLGEDYEVVSEGLCGRTLVVEDPAKLHRTGITHLRAILESADPVDVVVVMLGTNDVKSTYNLEPKDIAQHLELTISLIRNEKLEITKVPEIVIICPPPVINPKTNDLDKRMVRGIELFKELPGLYKQVTDKHGCTFINAGEHISSSDVDGYHLSKEAHLKLAEVVRDVILQINTFIKVSTK
jgi:lysophospholipase L1-like esterase